MAVYFEFSTMAEAQKPINVPDRLYNLKERVAPRDTLKEKGLRANLNHNSPSHHIDYSAIGRVSSLSSSVESRPSILNFAGFEVGTGEHRKVCRIVNSGRYPTRVHILPPAANSPFRLEYDKKVEAPISLFHSLSLTHTHTLSHFNDWSMASILS